MWSNHCLGNFQYSIVQCYHFGSHCIHCKLKGSQRSLFLFRSTIFHRKIQKDIQLGRISLIIVQILFTGILYTIYIHKYFKLINKYDFFVFAHIEYQITVYTYSPLLIYRRSPCVSLLRRRSETPISAP